nr:signal peptidase II [Anaerolineae bacterium]
MRENWRKWVLLGSVGGGILAVDQLVKWLVTQNLLLGESWKALQLVGDFIMVSRSHNTGAAFGIFPLASPFILALSLVTVVVFIVMYPRLPADALLSRIGLSMIVGGALSNALDRIRLGYVVDYVHVRLSPSLANISNFADHVITIGVVLFLIDQWRIERKEKQLSDAIEPDSQSQDEIEPEVNLAISD